MSRRDALVAELRDRLERDSFPRLTVLSILTLSGLAAFLSSVTWLWAGLDSMGLRYALATVVGYAAFILLIRVWIAVRRGWEPEADLDPLDVADMLPRNASEVPGRLNPFAGGETGGGGGGGSWHPTVDTPAEPLLEPVTTVKGGSTGSAGGSGSNGGGTSGGGFSLDLDELLWVVLAVLAVLGAFVALLYIIYAAPLLLAEVALDAALVSTVYRRLRKDEGRHWARGVIRQTWIPATVLVFFVALAGFALQHVVPDARSIGGVIRALAG